MEADRELKYLMKQEALGFSWAAAGFTLGRTLEAPSRSMILSSMTGSADHSFVLVQSILELPARFRGVVARKIVGNSSISVVSRHGFI